MTEAQTALYRALSEKAKEWAASQGLSDTYGMGALNAMWYTTLAAVRRTDGPGALTFAHVSATNRARCERWHPGFPAPDASGWSGADWSNAMCGEAGEAANVVKKLRRAEGVLDGNTDELLAKLADEIAYVFLYLDLLATYYGIDIPAAVVSKFNRVSELQGFPERLP